METNENQELELLLKQLTRNFINEQLQQLKNTKKDNNSFIYLESNTLNMLIVYLLMNMETQNSDITKKYSKESDIFQDELFEELDSVIVNNKKGFEEILSLLKEKT